MSKCNSYQALYSPDNRGWFQTDPYRDPFFALGTSKKVLCREGIVPRVDHCLGWGGGSGNPDEKWRKMKKGKGAGSCHLLRDLSTMVV